MPSDIQMKLRPMGVDVKDKAAADDEKMQALEEMQALFAPTSIY